MLIYPHYPNHFIDCVCAYQAQSYHAVMIRLPTMQYYLFICIYLLLIYLYIFYGVLEEAVAKVYHRYAIDFSKHINSEIVNALECCYV